MLVLLIHTIDNIYICIILHYILYTTWCYSVFSSLGQNILNHNLKEESFNFADGLRRFDPWLAGFKAEASWQKGTVWQSCLAHGSQEVEQESSAIGQCMGGPCPVPKVMCPLPIRAQPGVCCTHFLGIF